MWKSEVRDKGEREVPLARSGPGSLSSGRVEELPCLALGAQMEGEKGAWELRAWPSSASATLSLPHSSTLVQRVPSTLPS